MQYQAATDANIGTGGSGTGHITGQITMNTSGQGAIDMHVPVANPSASVNWCNFPGTTGCFSVGTFTGDSSGEIKGTFPFPHGSFAGVFGVTEGGVNVFQAGFSIPNGSTLFLAQMLPAGNITAGLGSQGAQVGVGSDPISSGSVTVAASSPTAHIELHGVVPSANYSAAFCFNGGGSGCFALGGLNSDASGNAALDVDMSKNGPGAGNSLSGVFLVMRQMDASHAPIEFISGFRVP